MHSLSHRRGTSFRRRLVEGAHHLVAADHLDEDEGNDEGESGTLRNTNNKRANWVRISLSKKKRGEMGQNFVSRGFDSIHPIPPPHPDTHFPLSSLQTVDRPHYSYPSHTRRSLHIHNGAMSGKKTLSPPSSKDHASLCAGKKLKKILLPGGKSRFREGVNNE